MLRDDALVRDIAACRLPPGAGAFWWLGQQSYVLKLGDAVVYLDPYLSPNPRRQTPPLLTPAQLAGAHLIVGSHDHSDHIDRPLWPAMAAAAPWATFVVSRPVAATLPAQLGLPAARVRGVADGETIELAGVRLTGLAAAHELRETDPATGADRHMTFLLQGNGLTVWFAGDTCIYEGLQTALCRQRPDLMLLPINGRDAKRFRRGCIGNMTYQEAVDLAGAVAPALVVPGHWDMFAGNTEDPQLFADYLAAKYPRVPGHIPVPGDRVVVRARAAAPGA